MSRTFHNVGIKHTMMMTQFVHRVKGKTNNDVTKYDGVTNHIDVTNHDDVIDHKSVLSEAAS